MCSLLCIDKATPFSLVPMQVLAQHPVACTTVKQGGPGTFSHMSDVTGRTTVERLLIECGQAQLDYC